MKDEFYAHSRIGKPPEEWHRLEDHLKSVAELARAFANDFQAGDWGCLAGLWHDLGGLGANLYYLQISFDLSGKEARYPE